MENSLEKCGFCTVTLHISPEVSPSSNALIKEFSYWGKGELPCLVVSTAISAYSKFYSYNLIATNITILVSIKISTFSKTSIYSIISVLLSSTEYYGLTA